MNNKGLTIFLIVLLSIVSILLIGIMALIIRFGFKFSFNGINNKESNNLYISKTYNNKFDEIILNTETANIYVKESNEFKIVIYSNNDVSVNDNNNKLIINEKKEKTSIFNVIVSKIEVYIPSDYSNNINIKNNLGKVVIAPFNKAIINIDTDYGDVDIASAHDITVNSDLGNVQIGSAKVINVKQSKGNAIIGTVEDANIINNLGNITIDNVMGHINIEEDCGNVHIKEANINENSYIKNNLGNIKVDKLNEIFVDAKNALGNTKVKNNYSSDVILTIQNDCGNITVNN